MTCCTPFLDRCCNKNTCDAATVCCCKGCGCCGSMVTMYCKINCLLCPFTILMLLVVSFALLPVPMYQESVLNNAGSATQMINTVFANVALQVEPCADAVSALFGMINRALMIVYGLLGIIGDALGLTYQGQPIFSWAQRELVERMHQRELIKQRVRQNYIDSMLVHYGVDSFDDLSEGHRYKVSVGAMREARMVPRQLPIFSSSVVCSFIFEAGTFLQDVLESFDTFIVQFFGAIITALIKAIRDGKSLPDILDILFDVLKDVILSKIPYGYCFTSIPMSLMQCVCSIKGTTSRIDVYAVGCLFKSQDCDVTGYTNGLLAMEGCLGIQNIINQVSNLLTDIQGVFEDVLGIQLDFSGLQDALNNISSGIDELSSLIGGSKLLNTHQRTLPFTKVGITQAEYDAQMNELRRRAHDRRVIIDRDGLRYIPSPEHTWKVPSNKTSYEIFIETNDLTNPIVKGVKDVHDYAVDHAEVAPHAATVIDTLHQFVNITLFLFRKPTLTLEEIHFHYGKLDIGGFKFAIHQLANHSRTYRSDNYTSVLPMEEYKRTIDETTQRVVDYTNYYGYGRPVTQSHIQRQFNESIQGMKQRSVEIEELNGRRQMEQRGLSVTLSIVGVLSTLLLGGVLMSVNCSTICGTCCAQGLNCCSGCSACAIVLITLIAFYGSGLITNLVTNSSNNNDFVTPFIDALKDVVLNSYKEPPTQIDIIDAVNNLGDAIMFNLNNVVIQAIRVNVKVAMFAIPILTLPDAMPDDDIISYIEALIFYPYFSPCVTDADCPRKGRCRARIDPSSSSNLCERDCTSDNPCYSPQGVCLVAPFLITGMCPTYEIPNFAATINFQCTTLGWMDDWLRWSATDTFQRVGWSPAFFVTPELWKWVWANMYSTVLSLRFLTRLVSVGVEIPATGLFTGFISNFPITIPFAGWLPSLTAITYFILPTVQSVIHWLGWFCGLFGFQPFTYFVEWQRFPNYLDSPDYGFATTSEWACFGVHTPSTVLGGYMWTNLLLIGLVAALNPFTIEIVTWLIETGGMLLVMCGGLRNRSWR